MIVVCPMSNQQVENDKIFLTVESNSLLECPVCGFIFADRNGFLSSMVQNGGYSESHQFFYKKTSFR